MRKLKFISLIIGVFMFAACGAGTSASSGETASGDLRIISIAPSNTEVIAELGFAAQIIATDNYSTDIEGIPSDLPLFDMMTLDGEMIVSLNPDIVFIAGFIPEDSNPAELLKNAGIDMVLVPSANSISEIYENIRLIASHLNAETKADEIIAYMQDEISKINDIVNNITEHRTVYFELDPSPIFTVGGDTFLNELLETAGGINAFGDQTGWIMVADEMIFAKNPDVILTNNAGSFKDPIGEISERSGWNNLDAVTNGRVYVVDRNATSRATHNIIIALRQLTTLIYPEYFN